MQLNKTPSDLLALAMGVAGGVAGHLGFMWLAGQGFYGLILPGGLAGIGAGLVLHRARYVAIVCGLLGIAAGVVTEYRYAPFVADGSFGYFVRHVADLRGLTLLMTALGGAIAFYGPFRSRSAERLYRTR